MQQGAQPQEHNVVGVQPGHRDERIAGLEDLVQPARREHEGEDRQDGALLRPLARPGGAGGLGGRVDEVDPQFEGTIDDLRVPNRAIADRAGAIVPIQALTPDEIRMGLDYERTGLLEERSVSVNTAAAGGNASLMSIG